MRCISVVLTGRADSSPLQPLMMELRKRGVEIGECHLLAFPDSAGPQWVMQAACNHISAFNPDIMVILGDRWESMGAAYAATYNRIPIAHIHGGEVTRGSFDNQIRDAITKLSHLHFAATDEAYCRIIHDLYEYHSPVYCFGAPGMDRFVDMPPRAPEKKFVVTWHPVTLCPDETNVPLMKALGSFPDYLQIWTQPCNDPGRVDCGIRLTDAEYIAHCRTAAAIIGNSSSGVIEAPYMQVPSVNIGRRQDGREKGPSVIDCPCETGAIIKAIRKAVAYDGPYDAPYGGPGASARIADILATFQLEGILLK